MGASSRRSEALVGPFRLDDCVREMGARLTMLGGSPFRILRLSEAQRALVDRAVDGAIAVNPRDRQLLGALVNAGILHPVVTTHPAPLADVDVVIPCRDHLPQLERLLASLPLKVFASVTVIDDASQAPIVGLPREVAVIRREIDPAPGRARQAGWKAGSAANVLFIDADVRGIGDWISPLLAWVSSPGVAAAAPRVLNADSDTSVLRYESHQSPLDLGCSPGVVIPRSKIPYVPSAALMVRREALLDVNGFDLDLVGGEDVDLVWRLSAIGWQVRYEPEATVEHLARGSWTALCKQRWSYGRSNAALAKRHPTSITPVEVSPYSAAAWTLMLAGKPGAVAAGVFGAASTAALIPHLMGHVEQPAKVALQVAGKGHVMAGGALATAIRRAWFPSWLACSLVSKRVRVALIAATVVPPVLEWYRKRPATAVLPWIAQRTLDDLAFAAGVWRGAVTHRSAAALVPRPATLGQLLVDAADLLPPLESDVSNR